MKQVYTCLMIFAFASVYSQAVISISQKPQFTKPDNLLPLKVDFSYYSKNFDKVFGEYNFTRNANNFGVRNVYVGYGNKFYYQNNSIFITDMPNNIYSLNFSSHQDVFGGLKNLSSLFTAEKDYSVKQP